MTITTEQRQEEIRQTVIETLFALGIDVTTPEAVQNFRRDMLHIRDWRLAGEEVKKKSMLTAVSILTAGILGWALMMASKAWQPFFH